MTRRNKPKTYSKRHPHCGLLPVDLRKKGMEIQVYGLTDEGLCYAGVHYAPAITVRLMYSLHRHWLRWRAWYDNLPENKDRNYPAKHIPMIRELVAHPVALHTQQTRLDITGIPFAVVRKGEA